MSNITHQIIASTSLSSGVIAADIIILLIALALIVLWLSGLWKTFVKAGRPGWAAIIPVYSTWVQAEVGGKPGYYAILIFGFGIVADVLGYESKGNNFLSFLYIIATLAEIGLYLWIYLAIAERFKKSLAFAVLLLFLPFVGFPILGYGDAKYKKPKMS